MSDERVLKVLAVIAAEALVAGGGLAERLGERLQIDMRAHWRPDETFLDLLTDKAALAGIAAEVGAVPSAKATGKELRGLIRRRLQGEGCQPVESWLPRYFEFPTRGYTERPVSEARAAYDKLARRGDGVAPRGRGGRNRIRGRGRRRNRRGRRVGRGRLSPRAGGEPPARCRRRPPTMNAARPAARITAQQGRREPRRRGGALARAGFDPFAGHAYAVLAVVLDWPAGGCPPPGTPAAAPSPEATPCTTSRWR